MGPLLLDQYTLNESGIETIPEFIGTMTAITHLDIGHIAGELPPFIANLTNLVYLGAASCGLRKLPKWLGDLHKLKQLDVRDNELKTFPNWMKNLKELEELELYGNPITGLPYFIGGFSRLKMLHAGGANNRDGKQYHLKTLPGSIGKLHHLEYLILGNMDCPLPDSIGNLSALKRLVLYNANINRLPETIGKLDNLEKLNLRCDGLLFLPETFGNLSNLHELDITCAHVIEHAACIEKLSGLKHLKINNSRTRCAGEASSGVCSMKDARDMVLDWGMHYIESPNVKGIGIFVIEPDDDSTQKIIACIENINGGIIAANEWKIQYEPDVLKKLFGDDPGETKRVDGKNAVYKFISFEQYRRPEAPLRSSGNGTMD
jgi:hypothetical protein